MAICTMCPSIILSNKTAPGYGWQCTCKELNCAHFLRCPACGNNRWELEKIGRVKNGRPVTMEAFLRVRVP